MKVYVLMTDYFDLDQNVIAVYDNSDIAKRDLDNYMKMYNRWAMIFELELSDKEIFV